jgi:hypothetical protein
MRPIIVLLGVLAAAPAAAQVQSRPTDPPLVTAVNESWYQLREPIHFAGELYYPAGASVFFNGNTMVRTGHYNGVPLYADTTVEPFSVVLVPVSRGLMQPYERPRRGALAGTTGSRPPSFPVAVTPESAPLRAAAGPPTAAPMPPGAISVYTPGDPSEARAAPAPVQEAVGTTGIVAAPRALQPSPVVTLRRPESNDGIWIRFGGERWVSRGASIAFSASEFVQVGEYSGRPVYARRTLSEEVIYVPTGAGRLAPYALKD